MKTLDLTFSHKGKGLLHGLADIEESVFFRIDEKYFDSLESNKANLEKCLKTIFRYFEKSIKENTWDHTEKLDITIDDRDAWNGQRLVYRFFIGSENGEAYIKMLHWKKINVRDDSRTTAKQAIKTIVDLYVQSVSHEQQDAA